MVGVVLRGHHTKKERKKYTGPKKSWKAPKLTLEERKANLKLKVEIFQSA